MKEPICILYQPFYHEILKCTMNENQGVNLPIALIKTPFFSLSKKMVILTKFTIKITNHLPWFLVESLKLEYQQMFGLKIASICYVINLGVQHHKIWKFYMQSKYLYPYLTYYINNFLQLCVSCQ